MLPMQKVIAATEVRNKLGELLNRVYRRQEHLVVEKLGIPVAAIISMQDYEQYQRMLAAARPTALGRKVGAEAERQGLTEEKLRQELRKTRQAVFQETYGEPAP